MTEVSPPVPVTVAVPAKDHLLSSAAYDVIKLLAQIVFPAAGALYFALSGLWGLPNAERVIGSITAVDIFLGVVLSVSAASYNKSTSKFGGEIQMVEDAGKKIYTLALNSDPELLDQMGQVLFKITKAAATPAAPPAA